jgi:hypothetical protein
MWVFIDGCMFLLSDQGLGLARPQAADGIVEDDQRQDDEDKDHDGALDRHVSPPLKKGRGRGEGRTHKAKSSAVFETAAVARHEVSREVMNAKEAAEFLRLSPDAFRKLAPSLPRYRIYERDGYRYLRSDLLVWLRNRTDSHVDSHPGAQRRAQAHKAPTVRGVKRLV